MRKLLIMVSAIFLLFAGLSCRGVQVSYEPEGPGPADHKVGKQHRGPPTWAPAHGRRRKEAYRYYPDSDVYYNKSRSEYIWLEAGQWKIGARLPESLEMVLKGQHVRVQIYDDDFSLHHAEIKDYYKDHDKRGKKGRGRGRGPNR